MKKENILPPDYEPRDVLLLGCGNSHDKRITFNAGNHGRGSPATHFKGDRLHLHDVDESLSPDTVHDLNVFPYPWADNSFDEIHAYEVLEHCGTQGDGEFFFGQFNEFHRILKPGGYMMISVPMWDCDAQWGVPDHRRALPVNVFAFLTEEYYENVGKPGYGDYRRFLKGYWLGIGADEAETQAHVVLQALKD
jgi:SAM-dependent methyltransferase